MVINWKDARVKIIPIKEKRKVKNIMLLPGMNNIDEKDWNVCKSYISKYDMRLIEILKETVKVKKGEKEVKMETTDFNKFSSELSRKAIDDCFSIKTLTEWRKKEEKADIRNLIDDKIKQIKERKFDKEIDKRED